MFHGVAELDTTERVSACAHTHTHTHTHTHKLTMLVVSDTAFALFKGNDAHSVFWMP